MSDASPSFDWPALGGQQSAAHDAAEQQARALARLLAAHGIITERDAAAEELADRFDALFETIWPKGHALDGFDLESSLGAHTIAKAAFDMVPAGRTSLRHEPLGRDGLIGALVEHGADEVAAASVVGDWAHVDEGFSGAAEGLTASTIAGLAERTLTRQERRRALNQVAVSPRCLNRLASTLNLLAAVRLLLPVVPPESAGDIALISVVGLVLGRPDRVAQLFDSRARTLQDRTWVELAQAQWALLQGETHAFDDDPLCARPAVDAAEDAPTPAPRGDTEVIGEAAETDGEGDDEDDVLEIVEERADPEAGVEGLAALTGPARWADAEPATDERIAAFWAALAEVRTPVAQLGGLLGVRPALAPATVGSNPAPLDERLLKALDDREAGPAGDEEMTERIAIDPLLHGHKLEVEGLPFDPVFPPVRGALRAVVSAAEGHTPSAETVSRAGDLAWALARARALGFLVQGDLTAAGGAVAGLSAALAPEGRWVEDRAIRFSGRTAEPVSSREARPVAAALVADLVQMLARTLAGTTR